MPATTPADLFAAVDVSGIQGNVGTLLLAFIGISMLFVAYKFVRRTVNKG